MAQVIPFNAVRPKDKLASKFCSQSINFYSEEELNQILNFNPNSFIQIIKPSFSNNNNLSKKKRYKAVQENYQKFKKNGLLVQDPKASYYIYRTQDRTHSFTGIIAGVSVEDYNNGVIKKHENTIETRESIFKNYLKSTRFNSEPVLITYNRSEVLSQVISEYKTQQPTATFKTSDGCTHSIWRIDTIEIIATIKSAFEKISSLYIADGHHRSASSALLSAEEKEINQSQSTDFFMAYLIHEEELVIKEYNRLFLGLNGLTKSKFLEQVKQNFDVTPIDTDLNSQKKKYSFTLYLKGQFYCVSLRKTPDKLENPLLELEAYLLQEMILKPILGVKNPRKDKRLQYSSESDNMIGIKRAVDQGLYDVGFGLKPVTIAQLKAIADANLVMPPKSTYIFPKLRSGITIYEF